MLRYDSQPTVQQIWAAMSAQLAACTNCMESFHGPEGVGRIPADYPPEEAEPLLQALQRLNAQRLLPPLRAAAACADPQHPPEWPVRPSIAPRSCPWRHGWRVPGQSRLLSRQEGVWGAWLAPDMSLVHACGSYVGMVCWAGQPSHPATTQPEPWVALSRM